MPGPARPIAFLEAALLRRSISEASAARERCRHCRRTPLVGERVHRYAADGGSDLVCDLCRSRCADAPLRSEIMHSPEHPRAVRVLGAAA